MSFLPIQTRIRNQKSKIVKLDHFVSFLPTHEEFCESVALYPGLQRQRKDPTAFSQSACSGQGEMLLEHSSRSVRHKSLWSTVASDAALLL